MVREFFDEMFNQLGDILLINQRANRENFIWIQDRFTVDWKEAAQGIKKFLHVYITF